MNKEFDNFINTTSSRRQFIKNIALLSLTSVFLSKLNQEAYAHPQAILRPSHDDGLPVFHIKEAYEDHPEEWFNLKTWGGGFWSPYSKWKLIRKGGLHYWDDNKVGEFFAQTEERIDSFRLFIGTNSDFVDHIKEGDRRPGLWIRTMPNTRVQLLDKDGDHINDHGSRVEEQAEDKGNVGLLLPTFDSKFGIRLEFDRPINQKDHRFKIGAEGTDNDLPTLDAPRYL